MKQEFSTVSEYKDLLNDLPEFDKPMSELAKNYNATLTKPEGSLGRLEELAWFFAGWQGTKKPKLENIQIAIFAGNHGVSNQGISAFPTEVTSQMVENFKNGGAAINQLAQLFDAKLQVYEMDLDLPTNDFTEKPALTEQECLDAISIGWNSVDPDSDLFLAGEMGIGNTTSAAAIAAALCGGAGVSWVGRGTGISDATLEKKVEVVDKGLAKHAVGVVPPLEILQRLGGREIAAIVGAISATRFNKIPFLLDGFICGSAALVLKKMFSGSIDHVVSSHVSAEYAHKKMLKKLNKKPLISLDLRLGEGSGAAVSLGIIKSALACHSGMASFDSAGVSNKD
ncbi:MAG: nicotinate-nucleotide--dimethylbenzimidazole phosphoribosyltransferase [Paracoccaceae bacterium]